MFISPNWPNFIRPFLTSGSRDFFSCALVRDILVQGRLYLTENYCCFHSTILRWETSARVEQKKLFLQNFQHFLEFFGTKFRKIWKNFSLFFETNFNIDSQAFFWEFYGIFEEEFF